MTPPEDKPVKHRDSGGGRVTTPARKRRFLEELRKHPNVTAAAEAAGVHRTRAYEWREEDPAFAVAWDQTLEAAVDKIEASMLDRASAQGDERDTTAAIFMLKQWRPKRYRETIRYELVQQEARRLADAYGLDADELIREAEAIAQGHERP